MERKRVELPLDELEPDGSFSGYASLFGTVDLSSDRVERGAFARSLAERGVGGIRMLYQHDPNEPIGAWTTIREDERGLFVRGKLAQGVKRARGARPDAFGRARRALHRLPHGQGAQGGDGRHPPYPRG